jgi:ABC-type phosphate transport system permease subunit
MKTQATRCTQRELAMLAYWQSKGIQIRRDQRIPLSTEMPPSFATEHPVLDALLGGFSIILPVAMAAYWLGKAAGVL